MKNTKVPSISYDWIRSNSSENESTYLDGSSTAFSSVSDKNSLGRLDAEYLVLEPFRFRINAPSPDCFLHFA